MSTSTAPSVRCPRCSAHLRAGSDWCSLCYADLRPAPAEPPPAPAAPPGEAVPACADAPSPSALPTDPSAAQHGTGEEAPRPRGKHARRASASDQKAATSADDVEILARQLLAELAATEQKDPLGPLAGLVDTTPKKVGLMVGGAVGAMCVLFILMAVLGALF